MFKGVNFSSMRDYPTIYFWSGGGTPLQLCFKNGGEIFDIFNNLIPDRGGVDRHFFTYRGFELSLNNSIEDLNEDTHLVIHANIGDKDPTSIKNLVANLRVAVRVANYTFRFVTLSILTGSPRFNVIISSDPCYPKSCFMGAWGRERKIIKVKF